MQLCRDQHSQQSGDTADVSSDSQELFRSAWVLVRESFEPHANSIEVLDFV